MFLDEDNSRDTDWANNTDAFQYRYTGYTKTEEGVANDAAAALCYRRLCRKHERLCDYREMLAGVGWYHWRMRSELRRAIRQILSEEIDLLDFLNVVLYLSRRRLWGNHPINLRQIA